MPVELLALELTEFYMEESATASRRDAAVRAVAAATEEERARLRMEVEQTLDRLEGDQRAATELEEGLDREMRGYLKSAALARKRSVESRLVSGGPVAPGGRFGASTQRSPAATGASPTPGIIGGEVLAEIRRALMMRGTPLHGIALTAFKIDYHSIRNGYERWNSHLSFAKRGGAREIHIRFAFSGFAGSSITTASFQLPPGTESRPDIKIQSHSGPNMDWPPVRVRHPRSGRWSVHVPAPGHAPQSGLRSGVSGANGIADGLDLRALVSCCSRCSGAGRAYANNKI
jgi:hypothetical protein